MPSKQDCFYIVEMIQARLIDASYTQPWAECIIEQWAATPPAWLCDVAMLRYHDHQLKALGEYIYGEPFVESPPDMEKFHLACLWLRYERREISWATFLTLAGDWLDRANADWACEVPYHYLNVFEDAYFSQESEAQTKKDYLSEQNLLPWIELARAKFEPFKQLRRQDKTNNSN